MKLTETSMQSTIVLEAKRCNKIRKKSKEKLKTATTTNVKLSTLFWIDCDCCVELQVKLEAWKWAPSTFSRRNT